MVAKNILRNAIYGLILSLPILDLVFINETVANAIRLTIVSAIFVATLIIYKDKLALKFFLIYGIVILGYFLIHNSLASNFQLKVPVHYDWKMEFMHLVRMTAPFLFAYVVYKNLKFDNKTQKILMIYLAIISSVIVITNLLGIAYSTYADKIIDGNFFAWFRSDVDHFNYASRGLFKYGNQIIACLLAGLPISIYVISKHQNILYKVILVLQLLALSMLGNRSSVFGSYLILIFVTIIIWWKRKTIKNVKSTLICLLSLILILPILIWKNPVINRLDRMINLPEITVIEKTINPLVDQPNSADDQAQYAILTLKRELRTKNIPEIFYLNNYPIENDQEFWENLNKIAAPITKNRFVERKILQRLVEVGGNYKHVWFGIGHINHVSVTTLERDYIHQFYSLGIFGVGLFIIPYFGIIIINWRKKRSKILKMDLAIFSLSLAIVIILSLAYWSGNIFNFLTVTLLGGFYLALVTSSLNMLESKEANS